MTTVARRRLQYVSGSNSLSVAALAPEGQALGVIAPELDVLGQNGA
jgi:hypothetical protein